MAEPKVKWDEAVYKRAKETVLKNKQKEEFEKVCFSANICPCCHTYNAFRQVYDEIGEWFDYQCKICGYEYYQ